MGKEANSSTYSLPEKSLNTPSAPVENNNSLFSMSEGIYLVTGVKNAAVCDTNTGNVYSINELGKKVLMEETEDEAFIDNLSSTLEISKPKKPINVEIEKPVFNLEFVWFEIISDNCNERCLHCYAESMPPTYRRKNLVGKELPVFESTQKLQARDWVNLIDQSYELGCKQCQFIGGEPFLWHGEKGETVLDLAEHTRSIGFEMVEIFTNATLVKEKDIQRIKSLGLSIAVSLYSDDEKIHDEITRTLGSYKKTIKTLQLLRDYGIPTRVETVLMKQNQNTAESVGQLISEMGFNHRPSDVLRPRGRGDNPGLFPDPDIFVEYGLMLEPNFSASPDFFKRSIQGHNCLVGKITITDNGDVMPCIFARGQIVGNVNKDGSIKNILEGNLRNIWNLTKDNVLVCQDCEYRYVCFDCRPMSEGAAQGNGNFETAPYPRCTYNPYDGEWGNGVWKLDEKGKPYYDTSMSEYIFQARQANISGLKAEGNC